MVESANREVRRYLRAVCYDQRLPATSWAANVPLAQRIQNGLVKEITGQKPCDILYAGAIDLDQGLIPQSENSSAPAVNPMDHSWEEWLHERRNFQEKAIKAAKEGINAHALANTLRDEGARTEFAVGSWVLKRYTPSEFNKGKPNKQALEKLGPFKVQAFKGQTYHLYDPLTGRTLAPCNVHLLSEFHYDPRTTNPADIRLKDKPDTYNVESIIRHTGSWHKKNSLRFVVRWENCSSAEDTVESWTHLRDNEALHHYMRKNKQEHHIPRAFREET